MSLPSLASRTLLRTASLSRSRLLPSVAPCPSLWRPSLSPSSLRSFSCSSFHLRDAPPSPPAHTLNGPATPIGQIDPLDRRLEITFTCTAQVPLNPEQKEHGAPARDCGHRSSHEFSRRSYEKGVVIVQCPECENRHLIADHLQWFHSTPSPAHPTGRSFVSSSSPAEAEQRQGRTIEDLMREKGEEVKWVVRERDEVGGGKTIEIGAPVEQ
ncbi:hypothetical protein JCM11641_005641 [Rhodosporidiobolus odoratus]